MNLDKKEELMKMSRDLNTAIEGLNPDIEPLKLSEEQGRLLFLLLNPSQVHQRAYLISSTVLNNRPIPAEEIKDLVNRNCLALYDKLKHLMTNEG